MLGTVQLPSNRELLCGSVWEGGGGGIGRRRGMTASVCERGRL